MYTLVIALFGAMLFCSSVELVGMESNYIPERSVSDCPARPKKPVKPKEDARSNLCTNSERSIINSSWGKRYLSKKLNRLKRGDMNGFPPKGDVLERLFELAQTVGRSDIVLRAIYENEVLKKVPMKDVPEKLHAPLLAYSEEKGVTQLLVVANDAEQEEDSTE